MRLSKVVVLSTAIVLSSSVPLGCIRDKPRIDGLSLSPDGSRVAFIMAMKDLCLLDLESRQIRRINTPGFLLEAYYGISWDPSGNFVVTTLVEGSRENPGSWGIWKVDVPAGPAERIGGIEGTPCQRGLVSPDGRSVVFWAAARKDLVCVNLQSRKQRFVTKSGNIFRRGYDWIAPSNTICFSGGFMTEDGGIWIMDSDGSNKQLLSDEFHPYVLSVSPSGKRLAFAINVENSTSLKLFVSNLKNFEPIEISPITRLHFDWHPMGDMLAFESEETIKVYNFLDQHSCRGQLREIAKGNCPVWTGDGQSLLYTRDKIELHIYELSSGRAKRLLRLATTPCTGSAASDKTSGQDKGR